LDSPLFFISPHILLTAAHYTTTNQYFGEPKQFLMSTRKGYIPSSTWNLGELFRLTLLHHWQEPGLEAITETEPQGNNVLTPCGFAFFR